MGNLSRPPRFKAENRDIERYVVFGYVKRAFANAMFIAAVIFAAFKIGVSEYANETIAVSGAVILSLASFFIFGWHRVIKEDNAVGVLVRKGFRGEIELPRGLISKGDVKAYTKAMVEGAEGSSLQKDVVYFFIETPDGKQIRKRYYDDGQMSFLFFDGDTVCVRRGLKYPQNLSAVHQESYLCLVCGNTVSDKTDVCPNCRHSIVKLDGHVPLEEEEYEEE